MEDWGLEGDAHAGKWHRQVSLLSGEKIDAFRAKGAEVEDGAFGENLVVEGIEFATVSYTHLDVYKRQLFMERISVFAPRRGVCRECPMIWDGWMT